MNQIAIAPTPNHLAAWNVFQLLKFCLQLIKLDHHMAVDVSRFHTSHFGSFRLLTLSLLISTNAFLLSVLEAN